MSKCTKCGNEILTGNIHWEMGLCNNCYNELYKDHETHISLDTMWLQLAQDFRDENEKLQDKISDLEAKLAESEKKLNQYPYKNEVIEEQYEDLKNGIKFRIKNNINDDWEQHYHCIYVLCEKHKARIRDIENSISAIAQLEQQLAEKDNKIANLNRKVRKEAQQALDNFKRIKEFEQQLAEKDDKIGKLEYELEWAKQDLNECAVGLEQKYNQDKISFVIEQLEKVKEDEDLYEMMFEYLNNQGVNIKGIDYWCLLDVPDDIKNNSIEFEQQFKKVYKSMFDTYFDGIIYCLTHQEDKEGK